MTVPFMIIGVIFTELIVALKAVDKIAFVARPITNLSEECGASFMTAFISAIYFLSPTSKSSRMHFSSFHQRFKVFQIVNEIALASKVFFVAGAHTLCDYSISLYSFCSMPFNIGGFLHQLFKDLFTFSSL